MKNLRTYTTWVSMHNRCKNKNLAEYPRYGGRGITVCDRWNSFENFYRDMGERPEGKTLDRYPDNDGNYEPSNCRWATRREQAANTSKNVRLTLNGRCLILEEWSRVTGIPPTVIRHRMDAGYSVEDALTMPWVKPPQRKRNWREHIRKMEERQRLRRERRERLRAAASKVDKVA